MMPRLLLRQMMYSAKRREGSKAYADDTLDHLLDLSITQASVDERTAGAVLLALAFQRCKELHDSRSRGAT
jgi:hypothetical protein